MTELSSAIKIITINLSCYFRHPLYVNVVHSSTLRHQGHGVAKILDESGTGTGSGPKNISNIFSKHGLVASSGAGDIYCLRLRLQFLAKRFRGFWSKAAVSGGSGSDSSLRLRISVCHCGWDGAHHSNSDQHPA